MKTSRCIYRICFCLLAALTSLASTRAAVSFERTSLSPIEVDPDGASGLDKIYVLFDLSGVDVVYTAQTSSTDVKWYRYSALGGGYAEEIPGITRQGNRTVLHSPQGDMGYIIEDGSSRTCFWITDYSAQPFSIRSISEGPAEECDRTSLIVDGEGAEMVYYSVNGRRMAIDRQITVSYSTLVYDQEQQLYRQEIVSEELQSLQSPVHITSPLCDTQVRISGDRFARTWGFEQSAAGPQIEARNVACETWCNVTAGNAPNQQKTTDDASGVLGGSAPVTISFHAAVTDAAVFREWQTSRYEGFDVIDLRFNELDMEHTFQEQGTIYVRFTTANASGSCDATSQIYTVYIGESALECPNAFSPGASPGVNDEWKVSYKSIVEFECHIFNRYGQQMAHFTDPSKGWDGKSGGKYVPAGVYYYVIKARGADGKKYNLSGDINIVKYR